MTSYIYIVDLQTQNNKNVLFSIHYYHKQSVNTIIAYIQYIINTHFKARSSTPRCHAFVTCLGQAIQHRDLLHAFHFEMGPKFSPVKRL